MLAYKAFNKDFKCRDFQYEIGKKYELDPSKIFPCEYGFHSCLLPVDTLNYYNAISTRYAEVWISGKIVNHEDKYCSSEISIIKEITLADMIAFSAEMLENEKDLNNGKDIDIFRKSQKKGMVDPGNNTLSASDDIDICVVSGDYAKVSTDYSYAKAIANGFMCRALSSGNYAHAIANGNNSLAVTSGSGSRAVAIGESANATGSGERSTVSVVGRNSKAVCTGYSCTAEAEGINSSAIATGYSSYAGAKGLNSSATVIGPRGHVKGGLGTILTLAHYVDECLVKMVTKKVGEDNIEPGTFYNLDYNGNFIWG